MSFTPPKRIERVTSAVHRMVYRLSGGRLGASVGSDRRPVGLLTTKGRKSGLDREWPVLVLEDEGRYVVAASNAGRDHHPAWYLNLRANPEVVLQVGELRFPATARVAAPDERQALWPRLTRMYAAFEHYAERTGRGIPVVILEPMGTR